MVQVVKSTKESHLQNYRSIFAFFDSAAGTGNFLWFFLKRVVTLGGKWALSRRSEHGAPVTLVARAKNERTVASVIAPN